MGVLVFVPLFCCFLSLFLQSFLFLGVRTFRSPEHAVTEESVHLNPLVVQASDGEDGSGLQSGEQLQREAGGPLRAGGAGGCG